MVAVEVVSVKNEGCFMSEMNLVQTGWDGKRLPIKMSHKPRALGLNLSCAYSNLAEDEPQNSIFIRKSKIALASNFMSSLPPGSSIVIPAFQSEASLPELIRRSGVVFPYLAASY